MDLIRILIGLLLVSWRSSMVFAHADPSSCARLATMLAPCVGYISGQQPSRPSNFCCLSVKNLKGMMKTKDDRVVICNCVKQAISVIKFDPKRIPLLPEKCDINDIQLPPVDKDYDCEKTKLVHMEVL
ncbi:non-specific lipid-transfer protein [Lactuca sativa]|uniref:non-specific lipid-transfer protein n=1 Tax=Lactuca sativa TaxID=4236 RepID=UPI000CA95B79|nr:non-specific lipid-transfer protein [Lactuca sativa]